MAAKERVKRYCATMEWFLAHMDAGDFVCRFGMISCLRRRKKILILRHHNFNSIKKHIPSFINLALIVSKYHWIQLWAIVTTILVRKRKHKDLFKLHIAICSYNKVQQPSLWVRNSFYCRTDGQTYWQTNARRANLQFAPVNR